MSNKETVLSAGTFWSPESLNTGGKNSLNLSEKELKKKAISDARSENINSAANGKPRYSETESQLFRDVKQSIDRLSSLFKRGRQSCIDAMEARGEVKKISEHQKRRHLQHAESELSTLKADAKTEVLKSSHAHIDALVNLRTFKVENDLQNRDAKYPRTMVLPLGIMLVVFVAETVVNGLAFQHIGGGILGGVGYAAFFSFINIILAAAHGIGWRHIIHVNTFKKTVGYILAGTTLFLGLGWNLFVAHFREMASSFDGLGDQSMDIISKVFSDPFGLTELSAIGLLIFGVFIFAIVAKDVYSGFTDPYFGYAKVQKEKEKAVESLENIESGVKDHAITIYDDLRTDLENSIEEEQLRIDEGKSTLEGLRSHRDDILSSMQIHQDKGNNLLHSYRNTFSSIRGTSPEHFSDVIDHMSVISAERGGDSDPFSIEALSDIMPKYELNKDANRAIYDALISESYEMEKQELNGIGVFLSEIYKEAEKSSDRGGKNSSLEIEESHETDGFDGPQLREVA